ncbi:MAG: hypothetical protein ABL957_12870 [Parvularculaceae bacterium]
MKVNRITVALAAAGFAAGAAALSAISGSASAGEWADRCVERLKADGRDTSGCSCLEARIDATPGLADEFTRLAEIPNPADRYAAASTDAKSAMDACTRK